MSTNGAEQPVEAMEVDAKSVTVITPPTARVPTVTFQVMLPAFQLQQARNNPQAAAELFRDPAFLAQINERFEEAQRNGNPTNRPN